MEDVQNALSRLSVNDFRILEKTQAVSQIQEFILSTVCSILGDRMEKSSISGLISDPLTLKRMEEFNPNCLTSSNIEELNIMFGKDPISEHNMKEVGCPDVLLNIYRWLKGLYTVTKQKKIQCSNKEIDRVNEDIIEVCQKVADSIHLEQPCEKDRGNEDWKSEYDVALVDLREIEKELEKQSCIEGLKTPTNRLSKLFSLVNIIMNEHDTWENAQKLMHDPKNFVKQVQKLNINEISRNRIDIVRVSLQDPELRLSLIEDDCKASGILLLWINAVVRLWLLGQYLETGETALSAHAEEEAIRQESQIIRSHSVLIDEIENEGMASPGNQREVELYRVERMPSIEDLM